MDHKPDDDVLLLELGEAYVHTSDKEKGAAALVKAAEMKHSDIILNNAAYDLADANLNLDVAHRFATEAVQQIESASAKISLDSLKPGDSQLMPKLGTYWDTLGWTEFRLGHLELAQKYLKAAFSLSQNPAISDHLKQLYEQEGKKRDAENQALRTGQGDLQEQRTTKLKKPASIKSHVSAEFFLLFSPDPKSPELAKLVDQHFISGSAELREVAKSLSDAKFDISFPHPGPVQILRRGVLDCETVLSYCVFVLFPPTAVKSAN